MAEPLLAQLESADQPKDAVARLTDAEVAAAVGRSPSERVALLLVAAAAQRKVGAAGLVDALAHASAKVRSAAADALGQLGDRSTGAAVLAALATEADPGTRRALLAALYTTGGPDAVPVLRRFLTHEDPGHRAFAGRSLGGLGATEALADLRAALAAETAPFARQQLEGAARALRPLSEWLVDLADPRPPVRRAAAAALAERGDVAALPQVTAACASEYDPPTLEVLRATLERLSRLRGPR